MAALGWPFFCYPYPGYFMAYAFFVIWAIKLIPNFAPRNEI